MTIQSMNALTLTLTLVGWALNTSGRGVGCGGVAVPCGVDSGLWTLDSGPLTRRCSPDPVDSPTSVSQQALALGAHGSI